MLRSVFAIVVGVMAGCHPAPAPTVAHAPPSARAPAAAASPVRQDFFAGDAIAPGPLHEVLATGHECRQPRPSPIDDAPMPIGGRPLTISVSPRGCVLPLR